MEKAKRKPQKTLQRERTHHWLSRIICALLNAATGAVVGLVIGNGVITISFNTFFFTGDEATYLEAFLAIISLLIIPALGILLAITGFIIGLTMPRLHIFAYVATIVFMGCIFQGWSVPNSLFNVAYLIPQNIETGWLISGLVWCLPVGIAVEIMLRLINSQIRW